MTIIHEAIATVRDAIASNPVLELAAVNAWLVYRKDDGDGSVWNDPIPQALSVCYECWPDIYVGGINRIWSGWTEADVEIYLLNEINKHLVLPLMALEWMDYGIPVRTYDVEHKDGKIEAAWLSNWERLMLNRILSWLQFEDIEPLKIAERLRQCLSDMPVGSEGYQVWVLLGWMFNCTGNAFMDYSFDSLLEDGSSEFLNWTPYNVDLCNDVQEEAEELYQAAHAGLWTVDRSKEWQQAIRRNARLMYKGKGRRRDRIKWPEAAGGSAASAATNAA